MLQFHIRIFRAQAGGNLPPQAGTLQHISLVDRSQLLAAAAGQLKAHPQHPFNFRLGIAHRIHARPALGSFVASLGLGVVKAAGQLPYHHHIHAIQNLRLQHAGLGQFRIDFHRADVGKDAQMRPQLQQSVLRAGRGRRVIPLRPAHRAEQHRVGVAGQFRHFRQQGSTVSVNGYAADIGVLPVKGMPKGAGYGIQGFDAFGGNFRADAVAAEDGNVKFHRVSLQRAKVKGKAGIRIPLKARRGKCPAPSRRPAARQCGRRHIQRRPQCNS